MTEQPQPGSTIARDPRTSEILDIFAKAAGADRAALRLDANITDLGIESLDMVQAVFELETHYNIDVPVLADQAGAEFGTVGALVSLVLQRLDQRVTAS